MTYPAEWKSRPGITLTCPRDHWTGTTPNVNRGPRTWQYRGNGKVASCTCGNSVKVPRAPQDAPKGCRCGGMLPELR